jgi:hypothetical protein
LFDTEIVPVFHVAFLSRQATITKSSETSRFVMP